MRGHVKNTWRHFAELTPGHRFQTLHHAHQGTHRSPLTRVWIITLGLVIVAIGIVALPAPGPGFLVIGVGGALLARESLAVARAMDWIEIRARRAWSGMRRVWERSSLAARVMASIVALAAALALLLVVRIRIG